ncbi:MAG: hypothetical protein ACI9VX_002138, partial [Dinoroseobacter sp.]
MSSSAQLSAEPVEVMLPALHPFAQPEETVGELSAVVHCPAVVCLQTMRGGKNGADPHSLPGRALHLQCPERGDRRAPGPAKNGAR